MNREVVSWGTIMARTIQKKVISDDLLFTDDFDENMLDKIEGELGRTNIHELPEERLLDYSSDKSRAPAPPGNQGEPLLAGEPTESEAFERDMAFSEFDDKYDEKTSAESLNGDSPPDKSEQQHDITKRLRSKKIVLFLAAASILLIFTGGLTYFLWPAPKKAETPRLDIVRHRIVIPVYEREINFLVLSSTQGKEDLLKLELELDFASFGAHEKFKDKQVYYADFIYGFLRKQSPPDNSVQDWVKILEEDLPERLKDNHPEIRLNSIRMKSFHRL
jgi:hypothetical protein